MSDLVKLKGFLLPSANPKEILRYARGSMDDAKTTELLEKCLIEAEEKITPKTCYRFFDVKIQGNICDFGVFKVCSTDLAKNLANCHKAIIFGATLGINFDRLILKYSRIAPSKAVMLQAIGAERVETLCDALCKELADKTKLLLKPRFSAGYGDLPLEIQKQIFSELALEKNLGITLGKNLLISPSKSVTAFVGLCKK